MNHHEWAIYDDRGVIYTGTEMQMILTFDAMKNGDWTAMPEDGIHGDLKLVEIHEVHR